MHGVYGRAVSWYISGMLLHSLLRNICGYCFTSKNSDVKLAAEPARETQFHSHMYCTRLTRSKSSADENCPISHRFHLPLSLELWRAALACWGLGRRTCALNPGRGGGRRGWSAPQPPLVRRDGWAAPSERWGQWCTFYGRAVWGKDEKNLLNHENIHWQWVKNTYFFVNNDYTINGFIQIFLPWCDTLNEYNNATK